MPRRSEYNKQSTVTVENFVSTLKENSKSSTKGTFDSAAAVDFVTTAINQNDSVEVPDTLKMVLDSVDKDESGVILRAVLDSASNYEAAHGQPMPADVMEQALHLAYTTTPDAAVKMDGVTGTSDQSTSAYQSNRAIVAIFSTVSEAIPFAHYLPADINSNKSTLAILEHIAGTDYGSYQKNGLLDGTYSGQRYISATREHVLTHGADGALTGAITTIQKTDSVCDPAGKPVRLLRGRSIVYVNGLIAAKEHSPTGTGESPVAGRITIKDQSYNISGTINTDNGEIKLQSSPALPDTAEVLVEAFIDYENAPELTPSIITQVQTFELMATPWRVITSQSMDSRTQMANELGLDSYSEGIIAINAQQANERHYDVLRKAKRIAKNNADTFDFKWSSAGDYKVRADIWRDFSSKLGELSLKMALTTMNHGITHIYVNAKVAAQLSGLPNDMWQPSGISARAGIFRLGRLFGQYDVYFTPRGVVEEAESAEILCIGQATDVTRNPFILGDAVAPTVMPLAVNSDMKTGAGFYARNYTAVNPHEKSAQGCALITVTNLF